jgi:hypothetical protein
LTNLIDKTINVYKIYTMDLLILIRYYRCSYLCLLISQTYYVFCIFINFRRLIL